MSIVVFILNFLIPFAGGTVAFMLGYPSREKKYIVNAWCHIALATLTYVSLIIASILADKSLIIFITMFILMPIVYVWGLVFGGLLICKARAVPLHLRMPVPITTNEY